jgi:hypothetical protein
MAGGAIISGTADTSRIEAPVTMKAYLMCAFAAFGGIFFGYDTGWMGGIMGMKYYIRQYTGQAVSTSFEILYFKIWKKNCVVSVGLKL